MNTEYYSDSNDWSDAEHHIEQAHDFYDHGNWHEALRELEAAIDINPNNIGCLFNKGITLDSLGRFSEAAQTYQNAIDLDPQDPELLNCLAGDYTRLGLYDRALEAFEKIENIAPDFEPAFCNRIITYTEMGHHEKAEEMFYQARQIKEFCPFCFYNMGNSLFARKLYDRAIWCWQQTKNITPDHPQINYRIAQGYWANKDPQKAHHHFLEELRHQPGDIEVLLDTGILLLEINKLESAKEKFTRIIELDNTHCLAHHYLGELHLHQKKWTQAVESFNRALELNPAQQGSHYRLGECYLHLGQLANAREHLLAELDASPDQLEVLLDLGCLLLEVDQITDAMICFERFIDLNPGDYVAYQNLSLCYYLTGLPNEGIDLSYKVLQLQQDHLPALHNLANAYLQKNAPDKAKPYIEKACLIEPSDQSLKKLKRKISLQIQWHRAGKTLHTFQKHLKITRSK